MEQVILIVGALALMYMITRFGKTGGILITFSVLGSIGGFFYQGILGIIIGALVGLSFGFYLLGKI